MHKAHALILVNHRDTCDISMSLYYSEFFIHIDDTIHSVNLSFIRSSVVYSLLSLFWFWESYYVDPQAVEKSLGWLPTHASCRLIEYSLCFHVGISTCSRQ